MPRTVFCAADTLAGPSSFFSIKNSFKFSQITRELINKARRKFMDAGNIARSLGNWSWSCCQKPQPFLLISGVAWFMPSLLLCLLCFSLCFLVSVFKGGNLVHWQWTRASLDQKLNPGIIDHGCGVESVGLSGAYWAGPSGGLWLEQAD